MPSKTNMKNKLLDLNNHLFAQLELPLAKRWNPRYVAYCSAHGAAPADMLQADRHRYPGGSMCGFLVWITGKWGEFRALPGNGTTAAKSPLFDAWLSDHAKLRALNLHGYKEMPDELRPTVLIMAKLEVKAKIRTRPGRGRKKIAGG